MTVVEALGQLDQILDQEERALVSIDLDQVLSLSGRKAELVALIESRLQVDGDVLTADISELAHNVPSKACKN